MEGTVCLIDYDLVHGRPRQCTTTTFILSCREFTVQASLLIQRSAYSQRPQSRSLATLLSIGNQKLSREGPGAQKSSEFRRFLGMLKYLRKSIPRLTEKTEPLRALVTRSKSARVSGDSQRAISSKIEKTCPNH